QRRDTVLDLDLALVPWRLDLALLDGFRTFRRLPAGRNFARRFSADRHENTRLAGIHGERHRFGCGPHQRPVAGRQGDAQPVPLGDADGDIVHLDRYPVALARFERLRMFVTVAVREIEQGESDARDFARRPYVVEAGGYKSDGSVHGEFQLDHW